jgi:hypothetical protein
MRKYKVTVRIKAEPRMVASVEVQAISEEHARHKVMSAGVVTESHGVVRDGATIYAVEDITND